MTITKLEREMLECVKNSEFHNGNNPLNNPVWMDCVSDNFGGTRKASGVVSSLVKKGLVWTQDEGKEAVIAITQAGLDALTPACAIRQIGGFEEEK